MAVLSGFDFSQPVWLWLALAALVLAIEIVTGTGWLLWPSVSAMVTGAIAALHPPFGVAGQVVVFSLLTIGSSLMARRFLPQTAPKEPDLNDQTARLMGQSGTVVDDFSAGHGRVFVGGAEWPASSLDDQSLVKGARVSVEAVVDGAQLKVRGIQS